MHNETLRGPQLGGTALVALAPAAAPPPAAPRPRASFLAQLIACHGRLPPYRERRRAAPDEAGLLYREADAPGAPRRRVVGVL
jgi:hypothetical protein